MPAPHPSDAESFSFQNKPAHFFPFEASEVLELFAKNRETDHPAYQDTGNSLWNSGKLEKLQRHPKKSGLKFDLNSTNFDAPGVPTYGVAYRLRNRIEGDLFSPVAGYSVLGSNIGYSKVSH